MKPLMVLAGGFGTRLRGLVADVPKPLAPVAGKPFLAHLIEQWVRQGVTEFIFLLHFEAHLIEAMLSDILRDKPFGDIKIEIIVECRPLGTGGSILNAVNILDIREPFLVVNADTWLNGGLKEINESAPNTIGTVTVSNCSRYGAVSVRNGIVQSFLEKNDSSRAGLINAGLYHLSPSIVLGLSEGASFSLEREVFPVVVSTGTLFALEIDADFIDIGIPEDYLKFCRWMELGEEFER
jgi:D-glycero-alpha-D-manno-heptose 1-phosphate guanylyltransferase